MISVAASFDTPSPSKAFLKPSMPPTVAGCLPAKGTFVPEDLVTVSSDWIKLRDVEPTLRVMLRAMDEFAMQVLR